MSLFRLSTFPEEIKSLEIKWSSKGISRTQMILFNWFVASPGISEMQQNSFNLLEESVGGIFLESFSTQFFYGHNLEK